MNLAEALLRALKEHAAGRFRGGIGVAAVTYGAGAC